MQKGHQISRERELHHRKHERACRHGVQTAVREHQAQGLYPAAPAHGQIRLPVVVELGAQALRHGCASHANRRHHRQAGMPIEHQQQRRHQSAGQQTAQRHTCLFEGEHQRHLVLGGGTGQQVGTRWGDRPITQTDQDGAQTHGRKPGHSTQEQTRCTQQQTPLADADGPQSIDGGATHQAGCHGTGIGHGHITAHQGGRDLEVLRHHGSHHGQGQQRHGDHGLDHQGQQQREPVVQFALTPALVNRLPRVSISYFRCARKASGRA